MIDKKDLIAVRDFLPGDRNFILATWLRGLYYGDSWFSLIPKAAFMSFYHGVIDRILSVAHVKVACLKDDPEVILGYSVSRIAQGTVVMDWLFVKASWRRIGIGTALTPPNLSAVTHLTKVGKALKPANVHFNPFLI